MSTRLLNREQRSASLLSEPTEDPAPFFPNQNRENQLLEKKTRELQKQLTTVSNRQNRIAQTIQVLKTQSLNAKSDLKQMRSILAAKKLEEASESHLLQLLDNQVGKSTQDIKTLESEKSSLKERTNQLQRLVEQKRDEMETTKNKLTSNEEIFTNYMMKVVEVDKLNEELRKTHLMDSTAISEMNAYLSRLQKKIVEKGKELADAESELSASKIQSDKIHKDLRKSQEERHQLIERWENAAILLRQTNKRLFAVKSNTPTALGTPARISNSNSENDFAQQFYAVKKEGDTLRRQIMQIQQKLAHEKEMKKNLARKNDDIQLEDDSHSYKSKEIDKIIEDETQRKSLLRKDLRNYKEKLGSIKQAIASQEAQEKQLEQQQIQLRKIERAQKKELKEMQTECGRLAEETKIIQANDLSRLSEELQERELTSNTKSKTAMAEKVAELQLRECEVFEQTKTAESAVGRSKLDIVKAKRSIEACRLKNEEKHKVLKQFFLENQKVESAVNKTVEDIKALEIQRDALKLKARKLSRKLGEKEQEVLAVGKRAEDQTLEQQIRIEELRLQKAELQMDCNKLEDERKKLKHQLNRANAEKLNFQELPNQPMLSMGSDFESEDQLEKTLSSLESQLTDIQEENLTLKHTLNALLNK